MRRLLPILIGTVFLANGCDSQKEKELAEAKAREEEAAARAARAAHATPKPGDWMWKNYRNPLDQNAKH